MNLEFVRARSILVPFHGDLARDPSSFACDGGQCLRHQYHSRGVVFDDICSTVEYHHVSFQSKGLTGKPHFMPCFGKTWFDPMSRRTTRA